MSTPKNVVVIPARGGSKGIPRKNIVPVGGQPLITWTIHPAKQAKLVDEVYVSTDDEEIAKTSMEYGAQIIKRPAQLATDTASSESVLLHFAKQVDFDVLVFLQCTSPLTTASDINNAIQMFLDKEFDSILSVTEDHGGFLCGGFTWTAEGKAANYDYKNRPRRQEMDATYRENGAIYITSKKALLETGSRLSGNIGLYEMPYYRSFEVDEPVDLELLRDIFPALLRRSLDKKALEQIQVIIFDVDGIFTDGSVYLDQKGNEMLRFSRIDGKGVELLRKEGYRIVVMSSEDSEIVRKRMEKLQVDEIYLGIKNKLSLYSELKDKWNVEDQQIAFCGDDIQDVPVMDKVGFSAVPANGQHENVIAADYISSHRGGHGFVRDIANTFISIKS